MNLVLRRWAVGAVVVLLVASLGACSSGDGTSGAEPTTTLPPEGGRPTGASPPTTSALYNGPQCQQVRAAVAELDTERRAASASNTAQREFGRQMNQLAVENPLCFDPVEKARIEVTYRESQAGTGAGGNQGSGGTGGQGTGGGGGGGGGGRSSTTAAR